MFEQILTVAGAKAELSQRFEEGFGQVVYAHVESRLGTRFADEFFDILAGFLIDLFDAPRVDASVLDQALQGVLGDFAAERVKAREHDHARGVVDDYLHAGDHLEGTDIAAVPADNSSFHIIGGDVDHRDGTLYGQLAGEALDGRGDDFLGPTVGIGDGLVLDFPYLAGGELAGALLEFGDEHAARFGLAESRYLFETSALLLHHLRGARFLRGDLRLPILLLLFALDKAAFLALEQVDLAVELLFPFL